MAEFDLIQTRRDEFKDYLEKGEVLQTLAKVLSDLFEEEEMPSNPVHYVKEKLTVPTISPKEIQALKQEINNATEELNGLRVENESLKDEITRLTNNLSNKNTADSKEAALDENTDY